MYDHPHASNLLGTEVTVEVLLFASYAEVIGRAQLSLELEPGATAADVVRVLRSMNGGHDLPSVPMVAVNERYAPGDQHLQSGDVVAIIPPVAGG